MVNTRPGSLEKSLLQSKLTTKLTKLKIPQSSTSTIVNISQQQEQHPDHEEEEEEVFDFSDVFGQNNNPSEPTVSGSGSAVEIEVIHHRSHSFVGPSPRYNPSPSLPFDSYLRSPTLQESSSEEDEIKEMVADIEVEKGENKIGPVDFEILRVVGKGAFGKVFQVRKRERNGGEVGSDGDGIFAMKVMRKETIIKNNHVDYMKAERDILTKVVHSFIVQLRYSFQTKSKLYLILDFINGGHLFYHLYRQGIFSEDQAKFYTAEIVSAVSHLHMCGIVHRDLKPENILMDSEGHVMLTDFGLAKEMDELSRSNSMCGTTEYMAPEILLSKGHNKEADWWSVGILLFEMLSGQPPYTHANRKKLQEKIIKEKIKLPPRVSTEAHSLLKALLQKEPSKRLGFGPSGAEDIKNHKWFKSINWKKLDNRELIPKFKPDVSGKECIANFDKCWTAMPPDDSPAATPTTGEHFQGYTYVAPNPWLSSP